MLTHNYDYRSNLAASEKVNWRLEDVIGGRTLDFGKPFLPESLAGVNGIRCLSPAEKLKLNQIRGFSYLYLFGLCEEYILPSVIEHAGEGTARRRLRDARSSPFRRGGSEAHPAVQVVREGVRERVRNALRRHRPGEGDRRRHPQPLPARRLPRHPPDRVDDAEALHGEREGQREEGLDPLFCSLLKHHWLEESQHAKLDTLIVDEIARTLEPAWIEAGIDDYMDIGKMLDGGLTAQIQLDLESLQKAIGRTLSAAERAEITAAQTQVVPLDVPRERHDPPELRQEPSRAERPGPRARRQSRARDRRLTARRWGATSARRSPCPHPRAIRCGGRRSR